MPAGPEGQSGSGEGNERVSVVQQLFGSEVETVSVCRCEWSSTRRSTELLFSLLYPHNVPGEGRDEGHHLHRCVSPSPVWM